MKCPNKNYKRNLDELCKDCEGILLKKDDGDYYCKKNKNYIGPALKVLRSYVINSIHHSNSNEEFLEGFFGKRLKSLINGFKIKNYKSYQVWLNFLKKAKD